jgi:hypothetical protein
MNSTMKESLENLANGIISRRGIDADEVKLLRLHIFSETRILERILEDGIIDRDEAETLFRINDALAGANAVDPSWSSLFVEAITSHILKDELSPSQLDEQEAQFLISRIGRSGRVEPLELELIVHVSASVWTAPSSFHSFVLEAVQNAVRESGVVDEHLAHMIRRVIFGPGSSSGHQVDETEKKFLREIEEATAGRENHPAWRLLLMELDVH